MEVCGKLVLHWSLVGKQLNVDDAVVVDISPRSVGNLNADPPSQITLQAI